MTLKFKPQEIDFFRKAESNRLAPENFTVTCGTKVLDTETTIDELISAVGYGGSHRSGVFEIQTAEGIIKHINGKKIDNRTHRKRTNILFKTWDAMEKEEALDGDVTWTKADSIVAQVAAQATIDSFFSL